MSVEKNGGRYTGRIQYPADRFGIPHSTIADANIHLVRARIVVEENQIETIMASTRKTYTESRAGNALFSRDTLSKTSHGSPIVNRPAICNQGPSDSTHMMASRSTIMRPCGVRQYEWA